MMITMAEPIPSINKMNQEIPEWQEKTEEREEMAMEAALSLLEAERQSHHYSWDVQYSRFNGPLWKKRIEEAEKGEYGGGIMQIAQDVCAATILYMRNLERKPLVQDHEL